MQKIRTNTLKKKSTGGGDHIKRNLKIFWFGFAGTAVFIVLLFFLISAGLFGKMPSFEELENPQSNLATEIISVDAKILGKYYIENRSNAHYQDINNAIIDALIATEDIRFKKHSGIDTRALFRVAFGLITGSNKGGGSTITQQLAKNLFPRKTDRNFIETVIIKLKEWITATKLERNYSKDEILAMYLNTVDFGSQSFGIKSAAKTFFNKAPAELKTEEAALLTGILKAPTKFSPIKNPEQSLARRNVVLHQMKRYDFLTEKAYDSISALPIDMSRYKLPDHASGVATYFREYLRGYLTAWCKQHTKEDGTPYNLYKDGLKVHTTINYKMQEYAEAAVRQHLANDLQPAFFNHWKGRPDAPFVFESGNTKAEIQKLLNQAMRRSDRYRKLKEREVPESKIRAIFNTRVKMSVFSWKGSFDTVMSPMDSIRYYKHFLQCGLMSMDPHTGQVKAYVGGIDYRYFQYDHVVFSKRQVGSTFKPFLYALAIQEGELTPCSKLPNIQPIIPLPDGNVWKPDNANEDRRGEEVTLKWALANSNNWISGQLIKRYPPQSVIRLAQKMGVTSDIPAVYSIALGSADISLYEMTGAMSVFVNRGVYIEPVFITRIEDKNGNLVASFKPKQNEAVNEETAYLMVALMQGVVESGTGVRLRYKYGFTNPIAGKTGTTQNQSDGWFIGLTPDLVTGVWVGNEDRAAHFRTITLGQGASMALPVWALYMQKIYTDKSLGIEKDKNFNDPPPGMDIQLDCTKYELEKPETRSTIDRF